MAAMNSMSPCPRDLESAAAQFPLQVPSHVSLFQKSGYGWMMKSTAQQHTFVRARRVTLSHLMRLQRPGTSELYREGVAEAPGEPGTTRVTLSDGLHCDVSEPLPVGVRVTLRMEPDRGEGMEKREGVGGQGKGEEVCSGVLTARAFWGSSSCRCTTFCAPRSGWSLWVREMVVGGRVGFSMCTDPNCSAGCRGFSVRRVAHVHQTLAPATPAVSLGGLDAPAQCRWVSYFASRLCRMRTTPSWLPRP